MVGIVFLTAVRAVVVTKLLTSGIFLSTSPVFSPNFVYLCFFDLCELTLLHRESILFPFVLSMLNFVF